MAPNPNPNPKPEDQSLTDFASKALRGPKKGALDQALSWYLFSALQAKPLDKIIKTREILGMLSENQLKEIEVDVNQFETFSVLAHTLANPSVYTRDLYGRAYAVSWPFPYNQETWDRYFKPWKPEILHLTFYSNLLAEHEEAIKEASEKKDRKTIFMIISSSSMGEPTYYAIKNRFIEWALPETMRVLSKIATLIEPSQFLEVASLDQAQKSEVKEPEVAP
jgi:hypothetical protein